MLAQLPFAVRCVQCPRQVTLDEFIEGIMRCKGPARAIDQAPARVNAITSHVKLCVWPALGIGRMHPLTAQRLQLLRVPCCFQVAMRALLQQVDHKLSKLTKKLVESGLGGLWSCLFVLFEQT